MSLATQRLGRTASGETLSSGRAEPRRAGPLRRLGWRAEYEWNNSNARPLRAVRSWWDCDAPRSFDAVVSHPVGYGPTIAYAGVPEGVLNVLAFLEQQRERSGAPTGRRAERRVAWRDLARGDALGADIVTVGCSPRRAARLPRERSLVLPFRLHLVVDVEPDADAMRSRVSKRERWQFSRNRRTRGWTWVEARDDGAFDFFYDRMHLPTMARRHGERMRTEGKDVAYESLFRRGPLFFVVEDGVPVAGVLCLWQSRTRTMTTRLLGVLDGDDAHYASGAFKAVYHFLNEWASANGVERVDYHGTEAFISKGIFQWKRKFHPSVVLPPNHFAGKRLWMHVASDTDAVRDFLVANPTFAMTEDDHLEAIYFHDRDRPVRNDLSSDTPGVVGRRDVDLDEFLGTSRRRGRNGG